MSEISLFEFEHLKRLLANLEGSSAAVALPCLYLNDSFQPAPAIRPNLRAPSTKMKKIYCCHQPKRRGRQLVRNLMPGN